MSLAGWIAGLIGRCSPRSIAAPVGGRAFALLLVAAYIGNLTAPPSWLDSAKCELRAADSMPAPVRLSRDGPAAVAALGRKAGSRASAPSHDFSPAAPPDAPTPADLAFAGPTGPSPRGSLHPAPGPQRHATGAPPRPYDAQAPPVASA